MSRQHEIQTYAAQPPVTFAGHSIEGRARKCDIRSVAERTPQQEGIQPLFRVDDVCVKRSFRLICLHFRSAGLLKHVA